MTFLLPILGYYSPTDSVQTSWFLSMLGHCCLTSATDSGIVENAALLTIFSIYTIFS
jgi:hypothetical protein